MTHTTTLEHTATHANSRAVATLNEPDAIRGE